MQRRRFTLAGLRPDTEPRATPESHFLKEVAKACQDIEVALPEERKAILLRTLLALVQSCKETN